MAPLPHLDPAQLHRLGLYEWDYFSLAYAIIVVAEAEANQNGIQADVLSSRVLGFLLLELFCRRHILVDQPWRKPQLEIVLGYCITTESLVSRSDIVFNLGRWYQNLLIRSCMFAHFLVICF